MSCESPHKATISPKESIKGENPLPRSSNPRQSIIEYLSTNGPVRDRSGRATGVLKEAIGYKGSQAGFIQLVASMSKSGQLERDVRGKRTYEVRVPLSSQQQGFVAKILPSSAPAGNGRDSSVGHEIDYDELAFTLLARATRLITESESSSEPTARSRRRLEQLETQNAVLERELARARAEVNAGNAESDALKEQLEAAQHNLELLAERTEPRQAASKLAARHLGPDDRALLNQLTGRGTVVRRSERAG